MQNDQLNFKIVKFHKKHLGRLREIWTLTGKNAFPDITDKLVIARCTVEDRNGIVIGGGFIRLTAEATVYLDPSLSTYKRANIIEELFRIGKLASTKKGIRELHAFLFDMKKFGHFLKKKLGFVELDCDTYCIKW